jgi:hypothetical protein
MSPQVLVVSRDAMLLQTRQLILGAFFQAECAGRVREAEALIATRRYDLIILCYTLTESERQDIRDMAAERKPRPMILLLSPVGSPPPEPEQGDARMTEAGPYYLLKKSAEMLGVEIRAKDHLVGV